MCVAVETARPGALNRKEFEMIHVVAIITTRPGQREAVLAAFRANMPAVHAEEGCIEYQPVVDTPDAAPFQDKVGADAFMVIEKWDSPKALAAHSVAPHMVAYGKAVREMVASRTVHILSPA